MKDNSKYNPTKRQIFSIPLNPYTSAEDIENIFIPFLQKYKDWIYDIFCTVRIPPFLQDAMGAVFREDQLAQMFQNAMTIEERTGVRVSATFNNTFVPPTKEYLDVFVSNLQYLYDAGLRSMTMPHNHWIMDGVLQEKFPEMQIKNTVLKRVQTAQDYWNACIMGYDYVNIDRVLLRDESELDNIKKAQLKFQDETGKYVPTALLANESCKGRCPAMDEHYLINNSSGSGHPGTNIPYFHQRISQPTCSKWRLEDPAYAFKMSNIPPYREDVERILEKVDLLKMHGREGFGLLNETILFIESYVAGDPELHDISVRTLIDELEVKPDVLTMWKTNIRNCRFQCWDCRMCDRLVDSAKKKRDEKYGSSIDDLIANFEG